MLNSQIIHDQFLLALILNGSKDIFAEGILTIQIAFFQCRTKSASLGMASLDVICSIKDTIAS